MATQSSTLAWEIPWKEEPRRLYSPRGRQESDTTERLHVSLHFIQREPRSLLGGHRALRFAPSCFLAVSRSGASRPLGNLERVLYLCVFFFFSEGSSHNKLKFLCVKSVGLLSLPDSPEKVCLVMQKYTPSRQGVCSGQRMAVPVSSFEW